MTSKRPCFVAAVIGALLALQAAEQRLGDATDLAQTSPTPLVAITLVRKLVRAFLPLLLAISALGCAPKPAVVEAPMPEVVKIDRGPTRMEQEIGGMNQDAVEAKFTAIQPAVLDCVAQGATRVREIGGAFTISLRIDQQGRARWAHLAESTLGDRETERCVLDVARGAEWPRPVGGEGLARRQFAVDPGVEPVAWEPNRIKSAMKRMIEKVAPCRKGQPGRFVATAYVRPNGRVFAAGVSPPRENAEDAADCVARELQKMVFGSPGRKAAKVTFEL